MIRYDGRLVIPESQVIITSYYPGGNACFLPPHDTADTTDEPEGNNSNGNNDTRVNSPYKSADMTGYDPGNDISGSDITTIAG